MDSFLPLLCSLLIGVVASNAALLPGQVYWHIVLPNTHMPTAISDHLSSDTDMDSKIRTYVSVGKGGVGVNAGVNPHSRKPTPFRLTSFSTYNHATTEEQLRDNLQTKWTFYNHAATDEQLRDNLQTKWTFYNHAATKEQLLDNHQNNLFFLDQDLHPGSKFKMQFEKRDATAKFLPRSEAESIPFSSKKLPEIFSRFSVQPGSDKEEAMKETLRECEDPVLKGEKKMCATSLESMVDFSVANLGTKNIKAVSTTVHSKDETPRQEYTIVASGVKNLSQDELVACHPQTYAYAVFHCHQIKSTKGYTVKMTGKDGTVVNAVAVCHADTSAWNPKHIAFILLNVKPGTVPVCHFMPQGHVVFSRNN